MKTRTNRPYEEVQAEANAVYDALTLVDANAGRTPDPLRVQRETEAQLKQLHGLGYIVVRGENV